MNVADVLRGLQFDDLPKDDRVSMQEVFDEYFTSNNDSDDSSDDEIFTQGKISAETKNK